MKSKIIIIILFSVLLIFTGCLRTYYPTGYQTGAAPIIFENDNDDKSTQYAGGDITASKGNYENESFELIRLNYLNVYTTKHFNTNSEIFGFGGMYNVSGLGNKYDGNKSTFGVGTDIKFNGNIKINKFKMGLGLNFGLGIEFGEYYNFRKRAINAGNISDESGALIFFMLSAFPVFSYEFTNSQIISAQVNVGLPGLLSPNITFNNDGYVFWASWLPDSENGDNFYGQRIVLGFAVNINHLGINL